MIAKFGLKIPVLFQLPWHFEFSGHSFVFYSSTCISVGTSRPSPFIGSPSLSRIITIQDHHYPGSHSLPKDQSISRHVECCFDKQGFLDVGSSHSLIFSHLLPFRCKHSLQLHNAWISKLPMVLTHVEWYWQCEKSSHSSFKAYINVSKICLLSLSVRHLVNLLSSKWSHYYNK